MIRSIPVSPTILRQFAKYATVAALGLFLHLGIIAGLVEWANFHYTLAFISALPVTYVTKFTLDKLWTFREKGE